MKNIVSSARDACLRLGLGSGLRAGVFSAAGFLSRRAGAGSPFRRRRAPRLRNGLRRVPSATRCAVRAFDRGRLPRFAEARAIPDLLSSTASCLHDGTGHAPRCAAENHRDRRIARPARTACPRGRPRRGRRACRREANRPRRRARARRPSRASRARARCRRRERLASPRGRGRVRAPPASRRTCRSRASMAGLSVPRPTRTPAPSSSSTGATPQPRNAFERGQWATATSCSREEIDLLGVDGHAVDGHQAIAQETGTRRAPDPGGARGRNEERGVGGEQRRSRPPASPVPRRSRRDASRQEARARDRRRTGRSTPCRAREARCRAGRGRRTTPATRSRFGSKRVVRSLASVTEHLEIDDAA